MFSFLSESDFCRFCLHVYYRLLALIDVLVDVQRHATDMGHFPLWGISSLKVLKNTANNILKYSKRYKTF